MKKFQRNFSTLECAHSNPMKKALSFIMLLILALPLAYSASSASFSTGSASLPENIEMGGHFGNYTLVAFSSGGKVTVAIFGADDNQSSLVSEINWLTQNEKFYTVCDIGSMPLPTKGQETYCDMNGTWKEESTVAPTSAPAPPPTGNEPAKDNGAGRMAMSVSAPQELSLIHI